MSERTRLRDEAERKLNQLVAEYKAKSESKDIEKYTEKARKEYLMNLSNEYYKKAKNLSKEYSTRIFAAGEKEIKELEKSLIAKEKEAQAKRRAMKQEDLLRENNNLIYSTFILNSGSSEQIENLLKENEDDKQIKELVKAKLSSIPKDKKDEFLEVQKLIDELDVDKVAVLKQDIRMEKIDLSSYSNFPTNKPFTIDLESLFDVTKHAAAKYFS